jgi:hypothetical protein
MADTTTNPAPTNGRPLTQVEPVSNVNASEQIIESDRGAAEYAKRQEKRLKKAAQADTDRAAEENRLPATAAITNPAASTANDMQAGGSFPEPEILGAIPVDHPSIENNPRLGTSAVQNGADYNEPFGRHPLDPEFAGQGLDLSVYGKAPR